MRFDKKGFQKGIRAQAGTLKVFLNDAIWVGIVLGMQGNMKGDTKVMFPSMFRNWISSTPRNLAEWVGKWVFGTPLAFLTGLLFLCGAAFKTILWMFYFVAAVIAVFLSSFGFEGSD